MAQMFLVWMKELEGPLLQMRVASISLIQEMSAVVFKGQTDKSWFDERLMNGEEWGAVATSSPATMSIEKLNIVQFYF